MLEIPLDKSQPNKVVEIRFALSKKDQVQLISFLAKNADVLAWSSKNMPGIDPKVFPNACPVKQIPQRFTLDRQKAVSNEVVYLMEAGFITEVNYPR